MFLINTLTQTRKQQIQAARCQLGIHHCYAAAQSSGGIDGSRIRPAEARGNHRAQHIHTALQQRLKHIVKLILRGLHEERRRLPRRTGA